MLNKFCHLHGPYEFVHILNPFSQLLLYCCMDLKETGQEYVSRFTR